ncbi:MAG: hypothetical protein QG602_2310 [Verrucomicrobiota bacterium]|nr:hypothetical protein [Verrucomicrobiota bacterium]
MAFSRAQFRNFTRELEVATRGLSGPEASRRLATTARQHIATVERRQSARSGGVMPDHLTIVDGRQGAAPESVKPDGVILIQWHYLTEAVIRTVNHLITNGPERSGAWQDSITTYVDDVAIPRTSRLPPGATEAVVAVRAEYARRLEVGRREGGGPFVLHVEQHFVQQSAIALRPILRPLGWEPRFTYIIIGADPAAVRLTRHNSTKGERRTQRAKDVRMRYPAIAVRRLRSASL